MLASLAPLARFAPTVLAKVADALVPGAGEIVRKLHEWYRDEREATEKAEILKALEITEEKLNTFDRMFIILGKECGGLLDRVAELEARGQDSSDEIAREVLRHPEIQERFDSLGLLVSILEHDVRRLDEQCASLSAFANELKAKQLSDTELADFRAFRQARQLQAAGRFAESEPILLKLANTQPKSAAVAVAQAVAKHDDPAAFDDALRRAVKLRPNDDDLKKLATAATVAVTHSRTPAGVPSSISRRVPQVGDTLDGWLLEARLGGGGWGLVFRASKKGQTKALKVMRPDLSAIPEFVEAFTDEVFKLLRLKHSNVVAVERNGFCTAFMCHYFVMPLLEGLNLEQHLTKHGVPSVEVAMGWLTGLLDGLEHAHANGLIHRDIKPLNVMILPDGRAVLIDFGIAGLDGVAGHTQALGKSSFFAPPEMHALGEADTRADLFMLAATVFYALRFSKPERQRSWNKFTKRRVPYVFRAAFAKALHANEEQRPANASDMRRLLTVDNGVGRDQTIPNREAIEQRETPERPEALAMLGGEQKTHVPTVAKSTPFPPQPKVTTATVSDPDRKKVLRERLLLGTGTVAERLEYLTLRIDQGEDAKRPDREVFFVPGGLVGLVSVALFALSFGGKELPYIGLPTWLVASGLLMLSGIISSFADGGPAPDTWKAFGPCPAQCPTDLDAARKWLRLPDDARQSG